MDKYNYKNKNLYYSYNTFKNYNNGVRGVIDPYPLSSTQNKMLKTPSNISYSYSLNPTCDGYYKLDGSCSS